MAMNRISDIVLGIVTIIVAVVLLALLLIWLGDLIKSLDVRIVVGIATVIGAVIGGILVKRFEGKHAVEAHFRDVKVEQYEAVIKKITGVFTKTADGRNISDKDLVTFFRNWQWTVTLLGGPKVLSAYLKWRDNVGNADAESVFIYGDFLLAMREDLGLSNKGLDRTMAAKLMLQNPKLLLELAKDNPSITLDDVAKEERKRSGQE